MYKYGCISLLLPRLHKLPRQFYSNEPDNFENLSSNKEIQPLFRNDYSNWNEAPDLSICIRHYILESYQCNGFLKGLLVIALKELQGYRKVHHDFVRTEMIFKLSKKNILRNRH